MKDILNRTEKSSQEFPVREGYRDKPLMHFVG
jgi:hypothetical protein